MDTNAIRRLLALFGITQSHDEQGELVWKTDIITDKDDSHPRSAFFDRNIGKWRLDNSANDQPLCSQSISNMAGRNHRSSSQLQDTNWTNTLHPSKHTDLFRNLDWAVTPLGSCSTWPQSLRLYTHMLFSDSRAAAVYWGPERIAIYNDNLVPNIGTLHPMSLGRSFKDIKPSLWGVFGPVFHAIEKERYGVSQSGLELPTLRNGYLEETWWNGELIPLKDDRGDHGGIYFSLVEVTRTTLRDRRAALVNKLGQFSHMSTSLMWQHIYEVFKDFPRDIPMAVMYSADREGPGEGPLHLRHTIGIDPTYTAAPDSLDFTSTDKDAALAPLLHRALETSAEFVVIDLSEENLHPSVLENITWMGFGEQSRNLVIMPLRARTLVRGYIILGLNPRRDFDVDHGNFITDLARQLREIVTRVTTEERTQKREKELLKELSGTERRISRLAEIAPVGIYELAADGSLCWANSHFYDIMGVPLGQRGESTFEWKDYIHPEDHDRATEQMGRSLIDAVEISDSLRLKRCYKPPKLDPDVHHADEPFWIIYSASPDLSVDGSVGSLMGTLTDVSHLKWSEQLYIRNAEAARRDRQRQEEFIDITSHEMRNPLSAITQCADSVILSLHDAKSQPDAQSLMDIIKLNAEAAESILFCAAHQKRIIDDVLTLGKLDSQLLSIFPTAFHPPSLVDQAMQMFKTEFDANMIEVRTSVDRTPDLIGTSAAYSDSSRLMQVLVNLLTNAIKFTRMRQTRNITIRSGLSECIPSTNLFGSGFEWHSTESLRPDLTHKSDYGEGEVVYLYYAVIDSGAGIPPASIDKVFSKFEQADRKTHTKYGGSGLGLYISRELVEMQGGRIGIKSRDGVGSTFAFYVKARRAEAEALKNTDIMGHTQPVTGTAKSFGLPKLDNSAVLSSPPSFTKYRILLVEDNLLNQKILAKQLERVGCTVRACNNGGEAIDSVLQMHGYPAEYGTLPPKDALSYFDCILMDWEMPVCDGLSATRRIREIEAQLGAARNVIIGITANARAEQMTTAMGAGMDAILPKPFRVAELLTKIGEFATLNTSGI